MKLRSLVPNSCIHESVSDIPMIGPPIAFEDRSREYINRSQICTWMQNWEWGRAVSFLGIFVSNFRDSAFAVHMKDLKPWEVHDFVPQTRQYWMIYRGPGFLAVLWFGSPPNPSNLPLPTSSTGDKQEYWERETTFWRGVGGGGETACAP